MARKSYAAVASRCVLIALSVGSILLAAHPGDLSGSWKLNREASDDPKQVIQEAAKNAPPRASDGGRGHGMHGMHHHGGTSPSEGGGPERDAGAMPDVETLMAGLDALKIEHHDPKLLITDSLGHEHVLYTDGRKIEEQGDTSGKTKIRAQWTDGHVVVKWEPEHGPTVTETYWVTADGKQLTVSMQFEGRGRMPKVTIRRVYDAVSSGPEQTPPPSGVVSTGG
jgi:hypothetical protein